MGEVLFSLNKYKVKSDSEDNDISSKNLKKPDTYMTNTVLNKNEKEEVAEVFEKEMIVQEESEEKEISPYFFNFKQYLNKK